ncbi:ABC-2 transporter permease [Alloiococcus sp. CFN-8]|uniref:ABC-2 transporter permease n=1 Tax=Alloiococcus sp. CFN-8 TaxID=3416081 RepID=UPI003CEC897B
MTGLLLKDILNLKSNFKTLIPITIFYICLLKFLGDEGLYRGIAAFMFANEAIASFSYDYMAKWDKYALSLPIKRADLVKSKYILAIMYILLGCIFSFFMDVILGYFDGTPNILQKLLTAYVFLIFVSIMISIRIPILYKFGMRKSTIASLFVIAFPIVLEFVMKKLGVNPLSDNIQLLILALSPLILALIIFISCLVSCNIYNSKEV